MGYSKSQVHPDDPGEFSHLEYCEESLVQVATAWTHAKCQSLGNLVWERQLLVINENQLYNHVVRSVVSQVKETISAAANPSDLPHGRARVIPFDVVPIPADGLCAWRGILASDYLKSFL